MGEGSHWYPTWWAGGKSGKIRHFKYSAYHGCLKTAEVPISYFGRPHQIIGSCGTWNLLKPQVFFTHAPAKPPCVRTSIYSYYLSRAYYGQGNVLNTSHLLHLV